MAYVCEVELSDVISKLPDISRIQMERDFSSLKDDLFLCALGFEDRSISIPRTIAGESEYRCSEAVYFEYSTNLEDNEINRPELLESLKRFSSIVSPMQCDSQEFAPTLRQMLTRLCRKGISPKVTFDISVCSSRLLLTVLKILFEFDIEFRLVYSEADIYHPTKDELAKKKNGSGEEEFGLTKGVSKVFPSHEHPGCNPDILPEAIVAFATFSPERTEAVISYVDENLLEKPGDRVIWVIGKPHLEEDHWRIDYVTQINKIPMESQSFKVSTFDYKETLKMLHKVYKQYSSEYHLNISPLGSKMQSLGIALFYCIRPDVTVIFAPPVKYNASHYSEGCKATWIIDFARLDKMRSLLDDVGMIKIKERKT